MTARDTARNVLVAAAVAAGLYVVWRVREVVVLAVLAVFVAVAMAPAVALVQRIPWVSRILAILLVYLGILGAFFALGTLVVPTVVDEVKTFTSQAPGFVRDIRDSSTLREYDRRYGIVAKLEGQANKLPSTLENAANELESVTVTVFERIFELVTIIVIAFFLLMDGQRLMDFFFRRLGANEARARTMAVEASRAVAGYVVGSAGIALLAGLVSFGAMEILGIPFSVPLAILMALFALIPLVGSAVGAAIIGLVACFESFPTTVIVWAVFFLVYQQLESHVLGPWVYKRTVELAPLLAIVAVLIGASLLGILGALIAIPAAATIQIVVKDWWKVREARRLADAAAGGGADGGEGEAGGERGPVPA